MARGLGGFNIEPPATAESTPPFKDVREPKRLKPDIIRPPSRTEQYKSCAMERSSVRVSDGRLLAIKVIAVVIGIIGIALLAFPDPMRKSDRQPWANKTIGFAGTSRYRKPERPY